MKTFKAVSTGLLTVAAAAAIYAAAVSAYKMPVYSEGPRRQPDRNGMYNYRGAIHIHSSHSHDGSGSVAEIAAAAKNNDLDFAVITDHNNMAAMAGDGYRDGVLILTGEEVSVDRGHFLALGLPRQLSESERHSPRVLDMSSALGAINIISHPFGGNTPWTRPETGGYDGIEIANLKTMAEEAVSFPYISMLLSAAAYPFNSDYSVLVLWRRPTEAIRFLGDLPAEKRLAVTCGTDAHGFPPYSVLLGQCINHVMSGSPFNGDRRHDTALVLDGLRKGRVYASFDGLARADNFVYACEKGPSGRVLSMSLAGFPKASLARASIMWGGNEIGSCRLGTDCKVAIPGSGQVLVEVSLTVPHVLWGTTTVPWIYATACGG